MILTVKKQEYTPHPEGIFPAVCVDVIDLGLREVRHDDKVSLKRMLKFVFETTHRDNGSAVFVSRMFTATLGNASNLADFISKWRGKPLEPGETIDTDSFIGKSATLVISQRKTDDGRLFSNIDAISKPTVAVQPSGLYRRQPPSSSKVDDSTSMNRKEPLAGNKGKDPEIPF